MAKCTFEFPADANAVARRLGISRGTLNGWIARDRELPPEARKFHFHVFRGRKRVWSETAFRALELAVERESSDGGCLGRWRCPGSAGSTAIEARSSGRAALEQVLNFRPGLTTSVSHERSAGSDSDAATEPAA